MLFRTLGGNTRHTLFFGFAFFGAHALLSVLLGFLFQLLLAHGVVACAVADGRDIFIALVVFVEFHIARARVDMAYRALGARLHGAVFVLFLFRLFLCRGRGSGLRLFLRRRFLLRLFLRLRLRLRRRGFLHGKVTV